MTIASLDRPTSGVPGSPGNAGPFLTPENVFGLIGNTPLVFPDEQVPVAVKLEGRNPTGSVFDRVGRYATFTAGDMHVDGTAALIAAVAQLGAVFEQRFTYRCTDP